MINQDEVRISPEEDARLPPYENLVRTRWEKFGPKSYQDFLNRGQAAVDRRVREIALQAIIILRQYQNAGLSPDMGREAAMESITSSLDL